MPGLKFTVESATAVPFAAQPTIAFHVRALNPNPSQSIQSVALRSQIMIDASRRHYERSERQNLQDLFGEPDRWSQTLRSILWTHVSTTVPKFSNEVGFDVLVPCTFDFNVGAAKYFHAIEDGEIPLCFQFSGTIFYSTDEGSLQIGQIGWDQESRFRLPANVWTEMMDHYYPNSAWLRLRRDAFARLYEYKRQNGMATWEEAIEALLPIAKEVAQ